MPAIVLIGAQWGDEGKGKATDLLGGRVQWVVRYQGGNNAGHTVVLPTRRELRAPPDPVGDPDARRHQRHRQRCRRRSRCAAHRAEGSRGPRRGHRAAADLGRRASADAVSRRHRQGRSSDTRAARRSAPPAAASAPAIRTRSPASVSVSPTCSTRRCWPKRSMPHWNSRIRCWSRSTTARHWTRRRWSRTC